jgi:hypothetical protein
MQLLLLPALTQYGIFCSKLYVIEFRYHVVFALLIFYETVGLEDIRHASVCMLYVYCISFNNTV